MRINLTSTRCAFLASASLIALPAYAQDAASSTALEAAANQEQDGSSSEQRSGPMLGEIVVTARQRSETLTDVPVAVSALNSADIGRYNASSLSQIAQSVPQVTVEKVGGGGSGAILVIRGVGSSSQDTGLASTVSVNIDGTQISRGGIAASGFFDLAQVEILKGPQALFFGKNSPAGVISLKSAGATKDLEAYVRAGYEFNAREKYAEAAISGPISETLGFRVAGRYSGMSGFEKVRGVVATPDTDPLFPHEPIRYGRSPRREEVIGRLTLEWKPTDSFSAVIKVLGDSVRDDTGANSSTEIVCANPNDKPIAFDFATGRPFVDTAGDCRADGRRTNAAMNAERAKAFPNSRGGQPYLRFDAVVASLNATYQADNFSITSITSYYKYRTDFLDNVEFASSGNFFAYNKSESSDFAQELRVQADVSDAVNVVVGGFYEHESFPFEQNVLLVPLGLDLGTGRFDNFSGGYDSKATTYSGFGQLNIDLLDNLQLSAGARYTRQRTRTVGGNDYVAAAFAGFGFSKAAGELLRGAATDENVSPEATLNWHPIPNTTLYVAYKTGFKSGGFAQANLITPAYTGATLRFQPEKVKGGEIGFKGELLDRRLRISGAIYRYTFDDLQVQNFDAATVSQQIRNAASARTSGVELEAKYQASDSLELHGAASYNDAKYVSYPDAPCYGGQTVAAGCVTIGGVATQVLSGRPLARAPRVNLSGGFVFDTPVADGYNIQLTGDVRYSSRYYNVETLNPTGQQSAFAAINASIRLHHPDDKWELALLGQNLTDRHYIVNAVDKPLVTGGQVAANVARGRQIALQGTVRF